METKHTMRSGFAVDTWHLLGTDASDRGSDDNGGGGESGDGERMVPAETAPVEEGIVEPGSLRWYALVAVLMWWMTLAPTSFAKVVGVLFEG